MSSLQQEESAYVKRKAAIQKIAAVFDSLPEKFAMRELFMLAGIAKFNSIQKRFFVASILRSAFKCEQINGFWRKP